MRIDTQANDARQPRSQKFLFTGIPLVGPVTLRFSPNGRRRDASSGWPFRLV